MMKKWHLVCLAAFVASTTVAAGDTRLTLRIPDATAAAGGMVQMQLRTTEVTPIMVGRPGFAYDSSMFDSAAGFGMFDEVGEMAGAAILDGDRIQIAYVSSSAVSTGYPIVTVVMAVRPDAAKGSKSLFSLDLSSSWHLTTTGLTGTKPAKPATVTVGGSVSITDIIPGEGTLPAGAVVTVRGLAFSNQTQVKFNDVTVASTRVVGPNELELTLGATTTITGKRLDVQNQDGSQAQYYSYMRGIDAARSSRLLLQHLEPIFSGWTHEAAVLGPFDDMTGAQYTAIAMQNPSPAPVTISLDLVAADGTPLYSTSLTLGSRGRLALEASELLDGVAPPQGSSIIVSASSPVDVFSLRCDEGTWTARPSLSR